MGGSGICVLESGFAEVPWMDTFWVKSDGEYLGVG